MEKANLLFLQTLVLLVALVGFVRPNARAEVSSLTIAAVVKSFDEQKVTLQVNKKIVTVPRTVVKQDSLTVGAAIFVTLRGEQIDYLLAGGNKAKSSRQPASIKKDQHH